MWIYLHLYYYISGFEKLTLPTINNNSSSLSSLTFHHLSLSLFHNLALSFSRTSNFALTSVKFLNSLWFSESLETEPHIQLLRDTQSEILFSFFFSLPFPPWSLALNSTAKENRSLSFSQNSAYHNWECFLNTQPRPNPSEIPPPKTLPQ